MCLHSMIEGYGIYLDYLYFSSFSRLMEVARREINQPERPQGRILICSSSLVRFAPKKRSMIVTVEKGNGAKASRPNKISYGNKGPGNF